MKEIYIGPICAEAHGYSLYIGKKALIIQQSDVLPMSLIYIEEAGRTLWIPTCDVVEEGATCALVTYPQDIHS